MVSAMLRAPLFGAALARHLGRGVVDARLRHPDLDGASAPPPYYVTQLRGTGGRSW